MHLLLWISCWPYIVNAFVESLTLSTVIELLLAIFKKRESEENYPKCALTSPLGVSIYSKAIKAWRIYYHIDMTALSVLPHFVLFKKAAF